MTEFRLKVPEDNNRVSEIKAGDVLFVTGDIVIARDQAHKKLLEPDKFTEELVGLPIFHCGPIAQKKGEEWTIVAGGPTTSTRMDALTPPILEKYKTKIIIGKGGLGEVGKKGLANFGAVYSEFTGGASALAVSKIVKVKKRLLEELGPTELVDLGSERLRTTTRNARPPRQRHKENRNKPSRRETRHSSKDLRLGLREFA